MSNHYHIVLHIDLEKADNWNSIDVIERWGEFFSMPVLISRFLKGECSTSAELKTVDEIIEKWRGRLQDISWFICILNEYIARESNKEDKVTGRFWEGRFKSQALLDEQALVTCMAYVDLNPIRADMAKSPDESDFTSIQERIQKVMCKQTCSLSPFHDKCTNKESAIPLI